MTITAKYASTCPTCGKPINAGDKIEWIKGSPARHVGCGNPTPVAKRCKECGKEAGYVGRGYFVRIGQDGLCSTCRQDRRDVQMYG